ncbi:methyltransferase domain-containing protein [Aestuariicoccus sp. MJ-SS9]|uniref:methyltransferase domain-containing protein n=1 Tax=Aestuariicoccus sp. MJ-SS9 TaxID=3079855 RepID=UPI0029087FDA|nr:methyltransferase domain-containing protein [Aestuariicoccus sp. MJ-SS9]MDU8914157.1 methyltransferase domain-containing protein [Aestuariicoccus sp. MJ-SS9]
MTDEPFYKSHWREIDTDRMKSYRAGFGWDAAADELYKAAQIFDGATVADFGCGPGKIAVELARRVGPKGKVHAIDINAEFLQIARENAAQAGVSDRVAVHQNEGVSLPFAEASLDRVTARNTIMYVDDPVATLSEFHRVLRPDGIAHAIDGDWFLMAAEPIDHDLWRSFVKAASHACKNSDMGRRLYRAFREAGFQDLEVSIHAKADVDGRLLGMIRNMSKYARESGLIDLGDVDLVVEQIEQAYADGTYLVVSPQFVVSGRKLEPNRAGFAGS